MKKQFIILLLLIIGIFVVANKSEAKINSYDYNAWNETITLHVDGFIPVGQICDIRPEATGVSFNNSSDLYNVVVNNIHVFGGADISFTGSFFWIGASDINLHGGVTLSGIWTFSGSNKINGNEAWREMYLEFFTDVILWLQEYYMRVHCESFHSAFKRVFGIIRKTRAHSKFVQVTARIILHNRARLSYFKKMK